MSKVRVTIGWRWIDENWCNNLHLQVYADQTEIRICNSMKECIDEINHTNTKVDIPYIEWPLKVEKIDD